MSIEIVTHCYSSPKVPVYHLLLRMQLNSVLTFTPLVETVVTVFYCNDDTQTKKVVEEAKTFASRERQAGLRINAWSLPPEQLFRRAIGRDMAAKNTKADVIWFTDCDHLFGPGCLDAAYEACCKIPAGADACWPGQVMINRTHAAGDCAIQQELSPLQRPLLGQLSINPSLFQRRTERKAIGGLQIVKGRVARAQGYLHGTRWTKPIEAKHFASCKCDVPFRKTLQWVPIDIPALYRVRHSRAGRDQGEKDHGQKTADRG